MTTFRPWTTTTCAGAGPPVTAPSTKRPALLAGDALQTLAFEVLSSDPSLRIATELRCRMLEVLSRAIGSQGMGGRPGDRPRRDGPLSRPRGARRDAPAQDGRAHSCQRPARRSVRVRRRGGAREARRIRAVRGARLPDSGRCPRCRGRHRRSRQGGGAPTPRWASPPTPPCSDWPSPAEGLSLSTRAPSPTCPASARPRTPLRMLSEYVVTRKR